MNLNVPLAIGIGGFCGALARAGVSAGMTRWLGETQSHFGTLAVNLLGCFAIGVLAALAAKNPGFSPTMQNFLMTGLLGSLTTFSTFAVDSLKLAQAGRPGAALMNVLLNLTVGLILVWLGTLAAGGLTPVEPAS